jgi:hypothetical protein
MNKKTSKRESFPNDMIKQAALTSARKQQKKNVPSQQIEFN